MYSSKPIIYAIESGKNNIVKQAKCGISVEAENSVQIAQAITDLYKMKSQDLEQLGYNGRKYVKQYFTYEKLAEKFIQIIGN